MLNRKGCSVLGWPEEELAGRDWCETCVPPEWRDEARGVFDRMVGDDGRSAEYYENPVMTRDGRQRQIAWHNCR